MSEQPPGPDDPSSYSSSSDVATAPCTVDSTLLKGRAFEEYRHPDPGTPASYLSPASSFQQSRSRCSSMDSPPSTTAEVTEDWSNFLLEKHIAELAQKNIRACHFAIQEENRVEGKREQIQVPLPAQPQLHHQSKLWPATKLQLQDDKYCNPYLQQSDHERLTAVVSSHNTTDAWVSANIINGACYCLTRARPEMNNVLFGHGNIWPRANDPYVQIMHVNGNHWITISNHDCPTNKVKIYDAARQKPKRTTLNKIGRYYYSLFCSSQPKVTFQLMPVERQPNDHDCGVYGIAFATSLLNNEDPSKRSYINPRDHLIQCLLSGCLSTFPSVLKSIPPAKPEEENVYCHCRGVRTLGSEIIVCDSCDNCIWSYTEPVFSSYIEPVGEWDCLWM